MFGLKSLLSERGLKEVHPVKKITDRFKVNSIYYKVIDVYLMRNSKSFHHFSDEISIKIDFTM